MSILDDIEEEVRAEKSTGKNTPSTPNFTSLGALFAEPEEETSFIVDDLLPSGGFSSLIAKPKVGKSTLVRQLALCIARGEPFLGRQTVKGPVLYLSVDIEKRGEIKKHFKLMGATGEEEIYIFADRTPEGANKWLEAAIEKYRPVLVIIDTLFRFVSVKDVIAYAEVNTALTNLLALARKYSAHLMCLHHARKMGGEGSDITLGSTSIFGTVDTSIILKKTEGGKRTIESEQRYGNNIEPTVLVFNTDSKQTTLGGTKEEDDTSQIADAIKQYLESRDDPADEPTINAEVEGRNTLKRKALRELVANGSVMRIGLGKKGNPFLYSCTLVPDIYTGQEKQETESTEKAQPVSPNSRSQDFPDSEPLRNSI
ncbi:MAG: AAA family ATPase [Minisyncoccia bacterium]|jgi:hypothetical protein